MSRRERVQVIALVATFICCIIVTIIVVPFAATSISFASKFDMVSPERTSWKIGVNAMFIALSIGLIAIFGNGKGKRKKRTTNARILKERWFAMFVAIYDFICFLGCLTGTILLIIAIIQYPGRWESVDNNEKRIEYEMNSNCCLLYKKDKPLIFKDCPLVNTTNQNVDFTNCKDEYEFTLCDKEDLNISNSRICPDIPKEDFPFQICSIVVGSILTIVYFSLATTFFITFFLEDCHLPRFNADPS